MNQKVASRFKVANSADGAVSSGCHQFPEKHGWDDHQLLSWLLLTWISGWIDSTSPKVALNPHRFSGCLLAPKIYITYISIVVFVMMQVHGFFINIRFQSISICNNCYWFFPFIILYENANVDPTVLSTYLAYKLWVTILIKLSQISNSFRKPLI